METPRSINYQREIRQYKYFFRHPVSPRSFFPTQSGGSCISRARVAPILRRTNTSRRAVLPRSVNATSNGTETCARYTRTEAHLSFTNRREISRWVVTRRLSLGANEYRGVEDRKRKRERGRRTRVCMSESSTFAYLRRQWASHLRHGRRFSSSDNSRDAYATRLCA